MRGAAALALTLCQVFFLRRAGDIISGVVSGRSP